MPKLISAQDSIAARYDRFNRLTTLVDSSFFFRVGQKDKQGNWKGVVREYYRSGKIRKAIYFEKGRENGQYVEFHENGNRKESGIYKNGERNGDWKFYYENGNLSDEKTFNNEGRVRGTVKKYFRNGQLWEEHKYVDVNKKERYDLVAMYDSLGGIMVKDGNGYAKEYDDWTSCYLEGIYKDGQRDGEWKGRHNKNRFTFTEFYQADTLVGGESMDSVGTKRKYTTIDEFPEYVGGQGELMKFLAKNVKYPEREAVEGIMGKVYIQFNVDEKGKVVDVKVKRWVSPGLDMESLRVIKLMTDWKPGSIRGVPMKRKYILPINFKIQ